MPRVKAAKKKRDLGAEIEALRMEVARALAMASQAQLIADEKRLGAARHLTFEEVSAVVGVSVTSLRRMKAAKALRYHRFGNVVNFSPEDLEWMQKNFAVLEGRK